MFKSKLAAILWSVIVLAWLFLIYRFETARVFTCFIPLSVGIAAVKEKKIRNTFIILFVVLWTVLFHYESTRHFYLNSLTEINLPKTKLLFPPAGWIMFYRVDARFGHAQVYGIQGEQKTLLDPHDILRVRTILYDNIHRGIMGSVINKRNGPQFCGYLKRRFPTFDNFLISYAHYPDISENRFNMREIPQYHCGSDE